MQEGLDYACQVVSEVLDEMGVAQGSSVARSVSDWRKQVGSVAEVYFTSFMNPEWGAVRINVLEKRVRHRSTQLDKHLNSSQLHNFKLIAETTYVQK